MNAHTQSTTKTLAALVASITFGVTSFGQAPPGWEHTPSMDKKLGGEGRWYINLQAKQLIPVRVIETKIVITVDQLDTLINSAVKTTPLKLASQEVPSETRFPCMSFIGTTIDNFPIELHILITPEHVYSLYAMTPALGARLPSKLGFDLAEWEAVMTSDKPMRPEKHSKYQQALIAIKSRLDSRHGD